MLKAKFSMQRNHGVECSHYGGGLRKTLIKKLLESETRERERERGHPPVHHSLAMLFSGLKYHPQVREYKNK